MLCESRMGRWAASAENTTFDAVCEYAHEALHSVPQDRTLGMDRSSRYNAIVKFEVRSDDAAVYRCVELWDDGGQVRGKVFESTVRS